MAFQALQLKITTYKNIENPSEQNLREKILVGNKKVIRNPISDITQHAVNDQA